MTATLSRASWTRSLFHCHRHRHRHRHCTSFPYRSFSSRADPHIASASSSDFPTSSPSSPSLTTSSLSALDAQLDTIRTLLSRRHHISVLTGAGISTDSNVPDYRSKGRPLHSPITHQQFMASERVRRRYWARSILGFMRMSYAEPNEGHRVLARAQSSGKISALLTQNVDSLHERAGSSGVIHLHGDISRVQCMQCKASTLRSDLQKRLVTMNPEFAEHVQAVVDDAAQRHQQSIAQALAAVHNHDEDAPMSRAEAAMRPDGDLELSNEAFYETFRVPSCESCGGILKADVVFFGDNVNANIKQQADTAVERSDALLVIGTTLTTWSAFRLVKQSIARASVINSLPPAAVTFTVATPGFSSVEAASKAPCLVAIVNDGPTRADSLLPSELKVGARIAHTLHKILD